ncbi:MAG: type II toxin-antitoxin system antitoxin SocA domain-containing protein [Methylovirgula sp.]
MSKQPSSTPYDPRSVCNLILDMADTADQPITNLALQKLLYFAHGLHLAETKTALVIGFFEAWQFGPVHPVAYRAFKSAEADPIRFRACLYDPFTRAELPLPKCTDTEVKARLARTLSVYAGMTPGRLVEVSHAKSAPWQFIVDKARTETILGLRITNDIILARFKFHKISIGSEPRYGEPKDEIPFDSEEELPFN